MKTDNLFNKLFVLIAVIFFGCESDDPVKEDAPEMITRVVLTFTPASGPIVVGIAIDPDGEGVQDLVTDGPVKLAPGVTYDLGIDMQNTLVMPNEEGYDITAEVEEEGDEHMFFFGWTGSLFSNPTGNGNIDSRTDPVNYNDEDMNNLPVGLSTSWTTATTGATGKLKILLKHQPDLKSATSTSDMGESDLDVEFDVIVE